MVNPLELLSTQFSLGNVIEVYTGTRGVSADKYKLTTTKGTYFVKAVTDVTDDRLRNIHDIERFMSSRGIPVVPEMPHTKALWIRIGNIAYKPSPFIDFVPRKKLDTNDFFRIGELLGKIHWASQKDAPARLFQRATKVLSVSEGLDTIEIARDLVRKSDNAGKTEILRHLDYKAIHLPNIRRGSIEVTDAIIHGDYTPGNILIDISGNIVAVCDWDNARYGSRSFEIIYTIMFSCFRVNRKHSEAFARARAFLNGYKSAYPITSSDILDGIDGFLYSITSDCSLEHSFLDQPRFDIASMAVHERKLMELMRSEQFRSDIIS